MATITPVLSPKDSIPEIPKEYKRMLEIKEVAGKTTVYINSSSLSILQQCPKKAHYTLRRNLRSKSESPATLFGSAIHSALEVFYSAPREERIIPTNLNKNLEIMAYGGVVDQESDSLLYRATRAFIERAAPLKSLPDTDKRSIPNGVWTLEHYFRDYIDDPYHILSDSEGPLVERTMETLLSSTPDLDIFLFGTVDAILENTANGQTVICDHKTSSVVGQQFYNRLKPNHQYTGYVHLAQQCLGLTTDNFLVNCIQVKPKPKTARGTAPHFPRQITKRTPEDISEFIATVKYYVSQYLLWIKEDLWAYGDVNNCTMYGGCQYLEVCGSPNSIKENILSANYQELK